MTLLLSFGQATSTTSDLSLALQLHAYYICAGGGTPHKPAVIAPNGHVIHESTSCAEYLIAKGMASGDILKEVSSYDTVGNAYFSATIHAIPAGWRRLAVVTSAFHMPRTKLLFEDVYSFTGLTVFGEADR